MNNKEKRKPIFPRGKNTKRSSPLRVSWAVRRTTAFYSAETGIDLQSIKKEPAGIPRNSPKNYPFEPLPASRTENFSRGGGKK